MNFPTDPLRGTFDHYTDVCAIKSVRYTSRVRDSPGNEFFGLWRFEIYVFLFSFYPDFPETLIFQHSSRLVTDLPACPI